MGIGLHNNFPTALTNKFSDNTTTMNARVMGRKYSSSYTDFPLDHCQASHHAHCNTRG